MASAGTQIAARLLALKATPSFLRIPLEIRHEIYHYYIESPGGYVWSLTEKRLKQANGDPINLSLTRVSAAIHNEFSEHNPFAKNSVTFRTAPSTEHSDLTPGYFHYLQGEIHRREAATLLRADSRHPVFDGHMFGGNNTAFLVPSMDQPTHTTLCHDFPNLRFFWDVLRSNGLPRPALFISAFDRLRVDGEHSLYPNQMLDDRVSNIHDVTHPGRDWGVSLSSKRAAVHAFVGMQLAMVTPLPGRNSFPDDSPSELEVEAAHEMHERYPPWHMPTRTACHDIWRNLALYMSGPDRSGPEVWKGELNFEHQDPRQPTGRPAPLWKGHIKFHVSAVAQFLDFIRFHFAGRFHKLLRNVVLVEDHLAVANPECHALGLIPFCKSNLQCHFERRVDFWRTILTTNPCYVTDADLLHRQARSAGGLEEWRVTRRINSWVMEADGLQAAGMPPNSFNLMIDAGNSANAATTLFDMRVHRDVAWQLALDRVSQLGAPVSELDRRRCTGYISEGFPRALQAIMAGTSVVSCNFDVGTSWPLDQIVAMLQPAAIQDMFIDWHAFGRLVDLGPSLPSWREIVDEEFVQ